MTCTVCNAFPGERTRMTFLDSETELTLTMCGECFSEFQRDECVTVRRVDR